MKTICELLLKTLNSKVSLITLILFCAISFAFGQSRHDMNLFAASGGVMTVCGLFCLIRFTTIEKYLKQQTIVANSTGITGPPLSDEEAKVLKEKNMAAAKERIQAELKSELAGIMLSIIGTLIWAYGSYVPIFY